ncbi:MAG: Nicotinate dehydrogenase large molybdopterin subunit [Alphaproteobacteria bacterium MarineAlpha3_Bin7]|nr:MAG: Nicotinate dehydrogenase large molybdopterin subunit [Alphaproteobacteria bacterium MarineAlpha3_Bin7]|tara:strand:- start:575 stop:1969 length:1395 start_codon:yes stop_codon:yes gene_type:complete
MVDKVKVKERESTLEELREVNDDLRLPSVPEKVSFPIDVVTPEARTQTPAVGQRASRPDGRMHGLGQTKYIDDMSFPGMIYAKIKRAGVAKARIKKIDLSEAEKMPGVMATLIGSEIPVNSFGPSYQDQPIIADKLIYHAGDPVAAVAATTEQLAADALEKIKIEYEQLEPIFDPIEAMKESAPEVHPGQGNIYSSKIIQKGDVDKGFKDSYRTYENTFSTQMVEHVPMEPHASIAEWDANGRVIIHSSLGRITLGRADIARTLDMPINRIRVVATVVGGNFGGKNEITTEPILALLSRKTGRPVKGIYTREDEFMSSTTRHPFIMDYKTGVSEEGKIISRKVRLVCDGGAYCSWSETTLGKACILSAGPYNIENLYVEAYAVYTNKTMTGAMRGFGAPQVCFAYESHMDDIARDLDIDPLQIRRINAFHEGSASPTGQVLQSVVVKDSLDVAADRFGWEEWQK